MGILSQHGYTVLNHYTPLHYLPFIARKGALLSKPALRSQGFADTHFRSKSRSLDEARGFGEYAHLTLHAQPPILRAKLAGGFPHVQIQVPVAALDEIPFDLCRFNVAMTRQLRRGESAGHAASSVNGRYIGARQIPVARARSDQAAMLDNATRLGGMIEVLVPGGLALPDDTKVHCYSEADAVGAAAILKTTRPSWHITVDGQPDAYTRKPLFVKQVDAFIKRAMEDQSWRGDGLEYDKV